MNSFLLTTEIPWTREWMAHPPHEWAWWWSYISGSLAQGSSNWNVQMNHLGILLKSLFRFGPSGWVWGFAFLAGSQEVLMLLVWGSWVAKEPRPLSDKVSHHMFYLGIRAKRPHDCVDLKPVSQRLPKANIKVCLSSDSRLQTRSRSQGLQCLKQFPQSQHWNT